MMRQLFIYGIALLSIFSCNKTTGPDNGKLNEKAEPYDFFSFQRSYPDRDFDWKGWRKALVSARLNEAVRQRGLSGCSGNAADWTLQGPANVAGRVNTLAVRPGDDNTVLAGFSAGGIFKTTDGGLNWHPVFDDNLQLSVGHIKFDPQNPDVVYAGTGDPNMPSIVFNGNGIYKSTDGGETWDYLGLEQQGIISKIEIDPTNTQVLYAATMGNPYVRDNDRGVYKSTDGGQSWQQVLFVSNQAGASDLVINPANPQILYASFWDRIRNNHESVTYGPNAGVYKTTDGGASWTQLSNGLPSGVMCRTGLAISQQNPEKVYAVYIDSLFTPGGLYKTTDGGDSWNAININALENSCSNFGWYFGKIELNPANDEEVFFHAILLWRKPAGSTNWVTAGGGHADSHDLVFTPSGKRYWANDGGVYTNIPGQSGWTKCKNLPTTQFYHTNFNPHLTDTYFAGAQDNGIQKGNGAGINNWVHVYPADGFRSVFHPDDPNTFWVEIQNGGIQKTTDGGDSWSYGPPCLGTTDRCNWDTPFFMSKFYSDKIYAATYRVYISPNGTSWAPISGDLTDGIIYEPRFHTISCLNESPVLAEKLYAGTTDGNVWRREPTSGWVKISAGLPDRYVTSVHGSGILPNRIFTTHSGFRDDEYIPHIHRSDDNGQSWTDISGDLPPVPVNDLLVLPDHADSVLFAATDAGVYFTLNSGANWNRLGANMPFIPVFDLEHNPVREELVSATYARGIWTFPLDSVFTQQNPVTVSAGGAIATETGSGVADVLTGNQSTGDNGVFFIPDLPGCSSYTITPYRNDFPLNGVSTYDLVLISKHILGLQALGSPFKLIAADANKSNSVTTFDIVTLRKLILGIDTAFLTNTSWRFIPNNHIFLNPSDPFSTPFPESLTVPLEDVPVNGLDFTALKVGDVNGTATPSLGGGFEERATAGEWPILLQNIDFEANETISVGFEAAISGVAGVQFSIHFDPEILYFENVEPLLSGLTSEHFGINRAAKGVLTVCFENTAALKKEFWQQPKNAARPLFRVRFKTRDRSNVQAGIRLGNFPTPALACTPDGKTLAPVLEFRNDPDAGSPLARVWPNPFGDKGVWIELPESVYPKGTIQIIDNQGKMIYQQQIPDAGISPKVLLPADIFPAKGVYFYKISGKAPQFGKLVYAP